MRNGEGLSHESQQLGLGTKGAKSCGQCRKVKQQILTLTNSLSQMNRITPRLLRALSTASSASSTTNTISAAEIALFSSLAEHWWNPTGEFALLHRMNPARVKFLRESLLKIEELDLSRWLTNRDVLDVGCGGGIFAEVRLHRCSI